MPLLKGRLLKPRYSLAGLFWLTLAVACVFLGRASTRWEGDKLKVQNLTFCEEIRGFGQIEPVANPRFTGGQQVLLYLDVQNLSQKSLGNAFETCLAGEYQILDPTNREVFTRQLPLDRQQSINRKRDHFAGYRISLPPLTEGEYRLRVLLRDSNAGRIGGATIPFQLVSIQN